MEAVGSCPRAEQGELGRVMGRLHPHFPTPAVSKGLSCSSQWPSLFVSSMTRHDMWRGGTTGSECVPAKSAGCQKFLYNCCCFLSCLDSVRWDEGEQEDWRCKFPTLGLLSSRPARGLEWSGACNLLTLQVVGRESGWWVRSRSVSTNHPLRKLLLDAPTLLKKTPPPARFPQGMSDQWSLGRGE